MSSSGVEVGDTVVAAFKALVKDRKHRAVIFKITDDATQIEMEKAFEPSSGTSDAKPDWNKMVKTLPENDCRYIAYDFTFEHQGAMKNKVLFVTWSPETAKIRSKMLYASSKDGLSKKLEGVQRSIQCNDEDDIDYAAVAKLLASNTAGY